MNVSVKSWNVQLGKHVIAIAIACVVVLMLPGCIIPNLRKPEPAPLPPETFNGAATPDNTSQIEVEEFYRDPRLTCLIDQALSPVGNRELKILDEEIQIASYEILGRSGAYLPFLSVGTTDGLQRVSKFTLEGAGLNSDPYLPGKYFTNPFGVFGGGLQLSWQLDIYRQLRNARDAAAKRYLGAIDRRNFFVTRLVAEIAENYYALMALDRRMENLDLTIALQERSLEVAKLLFATARGTELGVQRFLAQVRSNQSQKLIIRQDIIEVENRINFLVNRFPQPVVRATANFNEFFDLNIHDLSVGVPSQLLLNRPDIREAERDLEAAGLDVQVARVNFYPQLVLTGGVGLQSLVMNHLFEPQAVAGDILGGFVGPFVNFRAIKAQYLTANARQLQSLYNYQRVIIEAFTQVINRLTMIENYRQSIEVKKQQLEALISSVEIASRLFQNARADYIDVLTAQNAMMDARMDLIITKREQLAAVANAYQALGGGLNHRPFVGPPSPEDIAAGRVLAPPAVPPVDPANAGPKPVEPVAPRPEPAGGLPPALP